ncbi:ParD-like family protein [Vibrio mexicanus]|uniref:ParD-like family protein n=1 Tax=Vibrio mexicanus TaxID=1004326 RepID=UPI00063CF0EE|nr:ParD-like family protein [Vibrio mexicanus]
MGIVKISEELHEELRKASGAMHRSINSQAEFWIKIGMMAELNPELTFNELVAELLSSASVSATNIKSNQEAPVE